MSVPSLPSRIFGCRFGKFIGGALGIRERPQTASLSGGDMLARHVTASNVFLQRMIHKVPGSPA